ncbi:MAG: right-handed parallel beta-helix repeat-containing protein, partial [Eubacterium sp.]|nr:right-handed parallel beta-helix repeat-containing protein [Eubacterium sp.]
KSYFVNMKFMNNTFKNISGYAVIATNYKNSVISGNTMVNCGSGILFRTMDGSHKNFYEPKKTKYKIQKKYVKLKSKIVDNTITVTKPYKKGFQNVAYGIQLYGEKVSKKLSSQERKANKNNIVMPQGDFRISGVSVKNNTVNLNVCGYAVWLYGAVKNNVTGNTLTADIKSKGAGGNGDLIRLVTSSSNSLKNNKIKNITSTGYAPELRGICLTDSSNSNTVTGNTVTGAKKDGIKIEYSKSATISSNTVTKSGRDGIFVMETSGVYLTDNTVKSSKAYGLHAQKYQLKKESGNKVSGSGIRDRSWK